jgi:Phage integrase family
MAAAGVPMRTLQEWMGHRDIQTTQRYADYAPRTRDAELVAAAFRSGDAARDEEAEPHTPDGLQPGSGKYDEAQQEQQQDRRPG